MDNLELIVTALQQRIGEIVSQYEGQVAYLRAQITQLTNQQNNITNAPTGIKSNSKE